MRTIKLKGVIVSNEDKWIYDWFGYESVTPSEVSDMLEGITEGEDLTVEISSPGGGLGRKRCFLCFASSRQRAYATFVNVHDTQCFRRRTWRFPCYGPREQSPKGFQQGDRKCL